MKLESLPAELRWAVAAAQNKFASRITVLDLSELGAFTGYFLICSASSSPQMRAISEEIEEQLERRGRPLTHREGQPNGQWLLLDYGGFVVHIFHEQARLFFDLERLWRTARRLDIPDGQPSQAVG